MRAIRPIVLVVLGLMIASPHARGAAPATRPAADAAPQRGAGGDDVPARVVYVIDSSGSMLEMMDGLRIELRKGVEALNPTQAYNILAFQDAGYLAVSKAGLVQATEEGRAKAAPFLEKVIPRGQTDPIPALDAAARMKPEVVFLFTDGDFAGPGNEKVVEHCKRLFGKSGTRIHTIALLAPESKDKPEELAFVKALQEIAKNSGGNFRYASQEDLGK